MSATIDLNRLVPVPVATLSSGIPYGFDLYVRDGCGKPLLYVGKDYCLSDSELATLRDRGVRTLLIDCSAQAAYEEHLRALIDREWNLSPSTRFLAVKEASRSLFMSALTSQSIDPLVRITQDLADEMVEVICAEDEVVETLMSLLGHDFSTYTHVTNVSFYCMAIANLYGVSDRQELTEIAVGGLLHDIGKRHVPGAILNAPRKLTSHEFRTLKRHPTTGFAELSNVAGITWPQLMMIYQHHERMDGNGYPVGIDSSEIHWAGRLCAVADVYDALSSHRPYRRAMPHKEIREYFRTNTHKQFDAELVACLDTLLCNSEKQRELSL